MVYERTIDLIGNTPLVRLNNILNHSASKIYVKVERNNLTGSIKDRPCLNMIIKAFEENLIHQDSTLIEPTSGNFGISLTAICNYFNLKSIIVMPKSTSLERRKLIKDYQGEFVLVDGGMKECVEYAKELNSQIKNSIILSQFDNLYNPQAHYLTTIREIVNDLPNVDIIICSIGSGGTITGIGKYIKENNLNIELIGVEPEESPLITKKQVGEHKIQGIGANFLPSILDQSVIDKMILVNYKEAFNASRELVKKEGLLIGLSSGACLAAAKKLIKDKHYQNKNIVLIFPDCGERYSWE